MQKVFKLPKIQYSLLLLIFLLAIACDSGNNSGNSDDCPSFRFSEDACIGGFLTEDGLRFGCQNCVSDMRAEEFGLEFSPLLVSPDEVPNGLGTRFSIEGVENSFIPGFVDCTTVDLFKIIQLQNGESVRGEIVGSLEDLDSSQPIPFSFTLDAPGIEGEEIDCGFCWAPVRPPCADEL